MIEVNKIKELYQEHYQVILDFPEAQDLEKLLDKSYKYVWGVEHNEGRSSWSFYEHTLYGEKLINKSVYARNCIMEFIVETLDFIELLPHIKQSVKIVQTNVLPPSFLDLRRLKGKAKYDLLKTKLNYLFEIEIPGATDYSTIISSDKRFLEKVIKEFNAP